MNKNDFTKAMEYFSTSLNILDFHLGNFHPLHANIYKIFGLYYFDQNRLDDAFILYKSSLICSSRSLGSNHKNTGEAYYDLANLYQKMNKN